MLLNIQKVYHRQSNMMEMAIHQIVLMAIILKLALEKINRVLHMMVVKKKAKLIIYHQVMP